MSDGLKAILALVAASTIWGLSGIYFDVLREVPPLEVLSHRVLWSLAFFLALFAVQGRLRVFAGLVRQKRLMVWLGVTTLMVSANWYGYIWSIQNGYATQASLGYYMFPLMAVLFGFVLFRERFNRVQATAIAMATLAVVTLTVGLGAVPWIALLLAVTFATYGSLKKSLPVGPVMSVACEVLIAAPVALGLLIWLHAQGLGAFGASPQVSIWLALSAGFTGLPLVLFSYASKRLAYATVGLIQYLNPTLQFAVAMLYFAEPFTGTHAIVFPLIWTGVALYCIDLWRQERSARTHSIR